MERKRSVTKLVIAIVIIAALGAAMFMAYMKFGPQAEQGKKEIVVAVVIPNEKTKEFTLHTDAEFLRQALEEKKLIEGTESEYGLFITKVNGRTVDDSKKEWWCITQDGQQVNYGVDQIAIHDGDHYELTLTQG